MAIFSANILSIRKGGSVVIPGYNDICSNRQLSPKLSSSHPLHSTPVPHRLPYHWLPWLLQSDQEHAEWAIWDKHTCRRQHAANTAVAGCPLCKNTAAPCIFASRVGVQLLLSMHLSSGKHWYGKNAYHFCEDKVHCLSNVFSCPSSETKHHSSTMYS